MQDSGTKFAARPPGSGKHRKTAAIIVLVGLVLALSSQPASAASDGKPLEKSLRPLMDRAGEVQVKLPEENTEAKKAAEALYELYRSDAFQEKVGKERRRLAEEIFGADRKGVPGKSPGSSRDEDFASTGRFYLLVSSSMPLATLRNYAADLARLDDPRFTMVLRGFVGGASKIGPTASFIADVLKADPDCDLRSTGDCAVREIPFIVDPLLFRRSGIDQVPAVLYLPGKDVNGGPGENSSRALTEEETLIVYGDASLGHALELMARETGDRGLEQLAAILKPIP
jgi:type-F conjugative transfer system pilin assembly protein TrbC